jgi:MFS family permease
VDAVNPVARTRNELRTGFHGWRVSAAGAVIWAFQGLIWVQGFGNLAVVVRDQFGWSKTFFSAAFSITRAEGALLGVPLGMAIKRWNVKVIMRVGAILQLVGFLWISQIDTKAGFMAGMIIVAAGATLAGFLTITAATVAWFERKRARALSFSSMGFAVGGFAGPLLVFGFSAFGWRWTMALAGVVLAVVIWPLAAVMGVSRESTGEPVDGVDPETVAHQPRAEGVQDAHFSTREAVATRAFWMIALGHGSALLVVSSVMAHLQLYLTEDRGYGASRAAIVAGFVPLFQFVGTASGGYLGDRFNKRLIAGVAMLMHGIGLLSLTYATHWLLIAVFVVLHGLAWGARGPQMAAIRADYFGTSSFGPIMGISSLIITVFSISGPLLAGALADSTGDYQTGFTIISFLTIAGFVFFVLATPPNFVPASAGDTPEPARLEHQ